ncbi:hypothetical protein DACRYDRAFT_93284 [Dacryopinax primogenitus]|uniref:GATA-type domain-containing protein n=1 Tax=Dacryopinax primogenitus (strain DJM 731) TaxID=1858805 RepID=M5G3P5_DACPD|nr:uncharacterized protein DACRYDRAFT_93284 [Dacryopinax primogenitus]EJU04861.1 hypothetical protein DACRYDRAFT_93284 [Dacryopinax primogenitus]
MLGFKSGAHSLTHPMSPANKRELGISEQSSAGSSVSLKPAIVPPQVGKHRCYWTLLSESLKFLFLDPILTLHMGEQANALLGKDMLEYVHPEDKEKAVEDLKRVVRSKTLHGSVTRVRYRRVTSIRYLLGAVDLAPVPDAPLFCIDEQYLISDIVINCVGDNLVLCFFHAIVDKKPLEDQKEEEKSEWSNWCGSPSNVSIVEYAADMYNALIPNSQYVNQYPQRVFQILRAEGRGIVFTWPLNGYEVLEFGGIARDVNIGGSGEVGEARTSCTRRYKANWIGQLSGMPAEVESVYIPYGSIIFACHRPLFQEHSIEAANLLRSTYINNTAPYTQTGTQNSGYQTPTSATTAGGFGPGYPSHTYGSAQYSRSINNQQAENWPSTGVPPSPALSTSLPTPLSSMPPQPYPQPTLSQQRAESSPTSVQPSHPQHPTSSASPQSAQDGPGTADQAQPTPPQPKRPTRPPTGVQACVQCGNTTSPEWRKGPSGNKDLCNACGLRYSRTRAKEEGGEKMKRGKRKKKSVNVEDEEEDDGKNARKKRKDDDSPSPVPQASPVSPIQMLQPSQPLVSPSLLGGPQPLHLNGMGVGLPGWSQQMHPGEGLKVVVREPQGLDQPLLRKLPGVEDMFLLPTGLV